MSNVLQDIFYNYYEQILYKIHPRHSVMENIDRMVSCGDPSHGGAMYGCPCCGNRYNQQRSLNMFFKLIACTHRHCVFTIPEELRIFFLNDRSLLNVLFHLVRDVILLIFFKMNKREHFTPGFICALHTFGRDLKWNPHIHALISQGAAGNFLLGVLSPILTIHFFALLSVKSF